MKLKIYSWIKPLVVFVSIVCSNSLFAEGSKDLHPSGAAGIRAYLRCSTDVTENWPFANLGTHYVYAKVGERITIASSAQNQNSGRIRLINPSGTEVVNNTANGRILNRAEELAGPQLFGGSVTGRYTPIYYQVPSGGTGIYRVEFTSRATGGTGATTVAADSNWSQENASSIAAWDVSVINTGNTAFITGRVYSNILNLNTGTTTPSQHGFYGILYARTKDGYTYRVKNNGNNGMYFTFFVNNNGFIDSNGAPIYKSLASSSPAALAGKLHDPNTADTSKQVTHKMFYSLPNDDLPTSSSGAVPGGSTWLKNPVVVPSITAVSVVGVEGTSQQVGNLKGGYINFNADAQGNYQIVIQAPGFVTRTLTGPSVIGANKIYWDGKDGNGVPTDPGSVALGMDVTVRLQSGEVHFPFMDLEYNKNGFILELLNHTNLSQVVSDIIYWNDVDVPNATTGSNPDPKNNTHLPPVNSTGISSNVNGHIFGLGATSNTGTFGDNRAIDTWTFIAAEEVTVQSSAVVTNADLMISSITANKTNVTEGEQIIYTVKAKNGGVSNVTGAPFTFKIPNGFSPQSLTSASNGCGSENVAITFNSSTQTYSSKLNLPNGCEITYTFTVMVNNMATAGNQNVESTILRTNDVSDPDATNPDINVMPTNPYSECSNNGLGGSCNNIKIHNSVNVILACHNPVTNTANGTATTHGITLLKRAGNNNGNWPMIRKSAFTALESNYKGFVITRMTSDPSQTGAANYLSNDSQSKITDPVEGMIVYDMYSKCLKIYSDGVWSCFNSTACP